MGRLRGCLWLTAGLAVAVLAGAVGFIALNSQMDQGTGGVLETGGRVVDVVVAANAIEVRSLLTADNLQVRQLPAEAVPDGAVAALADAEGKVTLVDLYPGEIILAQRLVDPNVITGDGRFALVVAEDEVLMAFPAGDLMSRIGVLKPGDQVDLLFSLQFPTNRGLQPAAAEGEGAEGGSAQAGQEEEQVTFNLLQNVTIAAVVGGQTATGGQAGTPDALLFTVSPQDALLLKYAKDAGGIVDIVLRAPGVEAPFDIEPVDVDYMINRYRIPTEVGR